MLECAQGPLLSHFLHLFVHSHEPAYHFFVLVDIDWLFGQYRFLLVVYFMLVWAWHWLPFVHDLTTIQDIEINCIACTIYKQSCSLNMG